MESRVAWSLLVDYPVIYFDPKVGVRMCCFRGVTMSYRMLLALILYRNHIPVKGDLLSEYYKLRALGAFGEDEFKYDSWDTNEKMLYTFWVRFDDDTKAFIGKTPMRDLLKLCDQSPEGQ